MPTDLKSKLPWVGRWISSAREKLSFRQNPSNEQPRRRISEPLILSIVLISVAIGFYALVHIPRWQVDQIPALSLQRGPSVDIRRFELENEARKTLTNIVLGAFGLVALYLTWRRVRAGDRQAEVAEQGHITDRFTSAIEQLGKTDDEKPNIEIRLGGIYALERIARDSPRDHWTIMEVLTAYVRRNAPVQESSQDDPLHAERPSTDVQAILTVLGRREQGEDRGNRVLVLAETNLRKADFIKGQLQRAEFIKSQLQKANFVGANLQWADFTKAHLEKANFTEAQLEWARFVEAQLEFVDFVGANLQQADFTSANLQQADFKRAQLQGARFTEALVRDVHFIKAQLWGADFTGAQLQQAVFTGAQLQGADFAGAQLQGTNLRGAYGLTLEQIDNTTRDKYTKLPTYLSEDQEEEET